MTFDLDIWYDCSSWPYVGQIRRSRSQVKVRSHTGGKCCSIGRCDREWGLF